MDARFAIGEFPQFLPAAATWHARFFAGSGDDNIRDVFFPRHDHGANGAGFRALPQGMSGIFDVAAAEYLTVGGEQGRAHRVA